MAFSLRAEGATWQSIADTLCDIAEQCRTDAHYIWFCGALDPDREMQLIRLVDWLGLSDQFVLASAEEVPASARPIDLTVRHAPPSSANRLRAALRKWVSGFAHYRKYPR